MAKIQQNQEGTTDAPRTGDVGALLRVTRERANQSLRDVAEALRIRVTHLEAIEAGEYDRLPGATYAVGFVRAYADHLGLDSTEIVRRFKTESSIVPSNNELEMPIPVNDGGLPSGAAILLGLIVIGGLYGAWSWVSSSDRPVAEIVQEVPDRFMTLLDSTPDDDAAPAVEAAGEAAPGQQVDLSQSPRPSGAAPDAAPEPQGRGEAAAPLAVEPTTPPEPASVEPAPESVPAVVSPAQEPPDPAMAPAPEDAAPVFAETMTEDVVPPPEEDLPAAPEPAPTSEAAVETAAPVVPAAPEPPAPRPEAAASTPAPVAPDSVPTDGRVFGEENTDARVILRAREDSWVQVRDIQGLLLTRLLRAGDSYRVPRRPGLRLMTGNAGGLLIELDGKLLPPLGAAGEVRRNIPLDVDALRSGNATPN